MAQSTGSSVDHSIFLALAENALDAIIVADLAGNTTYANRAAYQLFGADYEKQDLNLKLSR